MALARWRNTADLHTADLRDHHDGCEPAALRIQDRMPVIIEPENWPLWLGEVDGDPATLLRPAVEDVLRVWPVDKKVGNVRNDGPELLKPRTPQEATLL